MRALTTCLTGALGFVLFACSGATNTGLEGPPGNNNNNKADGGTGITLDAGTSADGSMETDGGTCTIRKLSADPVPAELVLLVDHSGSMADTVSGNLTKWTEEVGAIKGFAADPSSARHYGSMTVHPAMNVGDVCAASAYATPQVSVGTFAVNQSKIATVLGSMAPADSSPWSAAIKAGLDFAKAEQAAHPERRVATVFVADDLPTTCSTDVMNQIVPMVQPYSEPMFVIGFSWYMSDQTTFDALAKAGKTNASTYFYGSQLTASVVKAQLAKIRDQLGCDVTLPTEKGGAIDPGQFDFEMEWQGTPLKGAQVAGANACTSGPQYWVRDAKRVVLCPQACKMLDDAQTKARFLSRCP